MRGDRHQSDRCLVVVRRFVPHRRRIAAYTTRPALRRRFVPDRLGRPTTFTWVACKRDLDFMRDFIPSVRVARFIADGGVNGLASRQRINLCIGQVGPRADDAKLLPVYEIARNLADEFQR